MSSVLIGAPFLENSFEILARSFSSFDLSIIGTPSTTMVLSKPSSYWTWYLKVIRTQWNTSVEEKLKTQTLIRYQSNQYLPQDRAGLRLGQPCCCIQRLEDTRCRNFPNSIAELGLVGVQILLTLPRQRESRCVSWSLKLDVEIEAWGSLWFFYIWSEHL